MRQGLRWALWLSCLVIVGLLVDGGLVAYGLHARLTAAAQDLHAGVAQLAGGRPDAAATEFTNALDSARSAGDLTSRPSFVLASLLPWLGPNSVAVEALTNAAELSAQAGYSAVNARKKMGPDVTSSLYRGGQVRFGPLGEARPYLGRAERLLSDAAFTVRAAPRPTIDSIARAVGSASTQLAAASRSAQRIVLLAEALPALLGADQPRRICLPSRA